MNRATVISMVQDLTEHKADQRLDFDNLFNLRLVKFVQEKPFWWRKKIFSFTTAPGVPLYDFNNFQATGAMLALNGAIYDPTGPTLVFQFPGNVAIPTWLIPGARATVSISEPALSGGPWTVVTVQPGGPGATPPTIIAFSVNLGTSPIPSGGGVEVVTGNIQQYISPVSLASDLESFIKVELWINGLKFGVLEPNFDIEDISDQQESVTPGPPSTYCVEPGTLTTMRLMSAPDRAYKVKSSYWACPQPGDDYSDNAIPLIPAMYHHGLVSGLKMDVTGFLYGEKSTLYAVSQGEYQESIQKAVARQDFSNQKMVQYIISDEAIASTPGN